MKDSDTGADSRSTKHLQSIDRRLLALERQTGIIMHVASAGLFQSWRKRLRPRLWIPHQYSSRRIRVPLQYRREQPPDHAPRIAIVTPSYNQGDLIAATIDSVLDQKYPNLVYLVQDGASTDSTKQVLQAYGSKIEWCSEADTGQGDAINRGFRSIDGDIMAYLNSDDVLLPGTLAYVARAFRDNPDIDVVYGHRVYIDFHGFEIGRCVLPPHDAEILKWADYIPQETLFWRRRVWEKIGPFEKASNLHSIGTSWYARKQLDLPSGDSPGFLPAFASIISKKTLTWGIWESARCIGSGRDVSLRLPVNTR